MAKTNSTKRGFASFKHGCSNNGGVRPVTPEYTSWLGMRQRCRNPRNQDFPTYGGRGIRVCERWDSFLTFLEDMGPKPSRKHELDRYPDKNGNYEPGNCRWATRTQNVRNTRFNRLITFNGETLCLAEWAERTGISAGLLQGRLTRLKWTVERALTTPTRKDKRQLCVND